MEREHPAVALTAYRVTTQALTLRVAPPQRQWMDQTPQRFAYRCLPLTIANQCGWELLCPADFTASWTEGSPFPKCSVSLAFDGERCSMVQSHFGEGIITFQTGYLFRTAPGYQLWVKGPTNSPKHGAAPLEGIVETDWSCAPFTMNWKLTRPDEPVTFVAGEPICTILPIQRGLLEAVVPRIAEIRAEPELFHHYQAWRQSRGEFLADLNRPGTQAQQEKWQRDYFLGKLPGGATVTDHATRLHLDEFTADGGTDEGE